MGASFAYEALSLILSIVFGSYACFALVESYYARHHDGHVTPLVSILNPWLAILAIYPSWRFYGLRQYLAGSRRRGCGRTPTYPHVDPVLGLDWLRAVQNSFKTHTVPQLFDETLKKVGNTFWVNLAGEWTLLTNEPENLKAIHATDFDIWPIAGPRLQATILAIGHKNIFAVNGKEWQRNRALIRPTFVRDQLSDMECFERHVTNLIARIPKDGSTVELQKLLYMMTMDSTTDFMFGQSSSTLTNPTPEATEFIDAFQYSMIGAAKKVRQGRISVLLPDPKLTWAVRTTKRFVSHYVDEVLREKKPAARKYVFLNELVASGADADEVTEGLLAILLAGRDTTAGTLSALFWYLARDARVMSKLRAEIDELGGAQPTWEQLKNMRYLVMCVKEALRLFPPLATNSRATIQDTVLPVGGGPEGKLPVFVPKGTTVRWSVHSTHLRKDLFGDDAADFRPERWEEARTSWEYLPFGGGPRICIGQQFSLTQMYYSVTRIFQQFRAVEARDDQPYRMAMSATIYLADGCKVAFVPR